MLLKLLQDSDYPEHETKFLHEGFTKGFPIGFKGNREVRCLAPNLKLECGDVFDRWEKMMKEVRLG